MNEELFENVEYAESMEKLKIHLALGEEYYEPEVKEQMVNAIVHWIEKETLKNMDSRPSLTIGTVLKALLKHFDDWGIAGELYAEVKARILAMIPEEEEKGVYQSVVVVAPDIEEKVMMLKVLTGLSDVELLEFRMELIKMRESEKFQFVSEVVQQELTKLANKNGEVRSYEELELAYRVKAKIEQQRKRGS